MITLNIELTREDGSRNLISLEDLDAISEVKRKENVFENGAMVEREFTKTQVLIKGGSWFVKETYEQLKERIKNAK